MYNLDNIGSNSEDKLAGIQADYYQEPDYNQKRDNDDEEIEEDYEDDNDESEELCVNL